MEGNSPDRASLAQALWRVAIAIVAVTLALLTATWSDHLTFILFREQDAPVLIVGMALLLLLAWRQRWVARFSAPRLPPAWAASLFVLVVAIVGTWLVFGDYPLSRDEVLADFDADYLSRGRLIATIPAAWQPYATALSPIFMLPIPAETGWMSGYLPGNAMLRAVFDQVGAREWTGPVLAAIAVMATWRVARRLWPEQPGTALVPVLLLAAAPQVLATAMTPYAMTGHLAFNMLFLWAFLRDDRRGDAGALAAGFVATGLHQIVFHPLFAAPFILELLIARRWRRAALYIVGYAAIGLFWTFYWQLVLAGTPAVDAPAQQGLGYLASRVTELLVGFGILNPVVMALNVLRFVAWNHLLLVPLALLAWPFIRRGEGVARPLALGIVLMPAMLLILLPWQGHGWGYRYWHGFIGSFALLAGYGWARLAADDRHARGVLAVTTAATVLLALPFLLVSAHDFTRPYRQAQTYFAQAPADVVVLDPSGTFFAQDLVRNRHDVSNRPVLVDLRFLTPDALRTLCRTHRIALFDRRHAAAFGIRLVETNEEPERRRLLTDLRCAPPLPLPARE